MTVDAAFEQELRDWLVQLYGHDAAEWLPRFLSTLRNHVERLNRSDRVTVAERGQEGRSDSRLSRWSQRDVMLITYADQLRTPGQSALRTLDQFLNRSALDRLINRVHLLPFYPYSSDDGFSVIDYRSVDPGVGTWADVDTLAERMQLTFDLVLNHISSQSEWFQKYLAGDPKWSEFFIEQSADADLSSVTRPRSSPLLTPYSTANGPRHVWTTFSADQIDLNFANPQVLLEIIDILFTYIGHGATCIRLDAIAYLWKEVGTPCIHLDQTHTVVKLLRGICDALAPHVRILTETNVPHDENVSYFGQGDEADIVYQFSLPPLLLDAVIHQDAAPLMSWLGDLTPPPDGATFLNFTASHDGIGVRPLEGLVSTDRRAALVSAVRERGGLVGMRANDEGEEIPYELNIAYVDAVSGGPGCDTADHARRFLATQAIMLALQGVPGIYFHSLVGSQNDRRAALSSGIPRRINRQKLNASQLETSLADRQSLPGRIFRAYQDLLSVRIEQDAFHPLASQAVLPTSHPAQIAFLRTSHDRRQRLAVLGNMSDTRQPYDLGRLHSAGRACDLLTGRSHEGRVIQLEPFQVQWLALP